jgi:hypothetical protein
MPDGSTIDRRRPAQQNLRNESLNMDVAPFIPKLDEMLGVLGASADVCYALDPDLRLIYRNPAWDKFALENGAPELASDAVYGTDLRQVIGGDLIPFYMAAFATLERDRAVWECTYECSSPVAFRKFRMQIQPLAPSGYLVRNSLMIEHAHAPSALATFQDPLRPDSTIVVCMHCRCTRRVHLPSHWDFVPAHLDRSLTNVSHSLCPVCLDYFYPQ